MNQNVNRLLELAAELLACRGEDDLVTILDRHLPALCPPGTWQIWQKKNAGWSCEFRGRRKSGFESITPQKLAQLVATAPPPSSPGEGLQVVPLGEGRDHRLLLLHTEQPPAETLDRLALLLAPALDNLRSRIQLEQQIITDEVSGLFNARHFRSLVDYEMERARRYGQDLSVIFFDLDHFKQVNDTHGHLIGSQVLQQIGQFLRTRTRRVNISCRYGGDEYVLLLPSTNKAGALTLAEKLRKELAEYPFVFDGIEPIRITASFGVASFPGDALNPEKLLQQADRAMYRVKAAGRDGVAAA
ncbi:MAG: GGDEF domain-containing protein [Gammaproteobacteria bacterium]|nr:MAG: GGDEF domain-containing protein [Gammaproteobacteria bacterium]